MIHYRQIVLPTFLSLMMLFFCSASSQANQLLSIEITSSQDAAVPIAIVPFDSKNKGVEAIDIAAIVQSDLASSGEFKPLARDSMLSRPSSRQDIVLRDWRVLDMDYVVVGQESHQAGRVQIQYSLIEVATGKVLPLDKSTVTGSDERALAHLISDSIYEAITGKQGVFSTEVVYVSQVRTSNGLTYELQKSDADGHRSKTLLRSNEPIMSPAWAPDGQHIAYVSYESTRPAIYMHNTITGAKRQLIQYPGINGAPDWSPDGQYLTMTLSKDGNPEIYTFSLATGRLNRLTQHFSIDTEPRWTPDGKNIIFTSDRGGSPQIYKINVASKKIKRLTYDGTYNARGTITADGKNLVMVHRVDGSFHIAVQDLKYGETRILTSTRLDESPTVAPNGQLVMFATRDGDKGLLSIVSLDGRTQIRLPSKVGEVREPAWSPYLRAN